MSNIRRVLTIAACSVIATGIASASTLTGFQSASGSLTGTPFSDPPTSSTSVSFNQFNQSAANATIAAECPVGYVCSTATLVQIDLSLSATGVGNITLSNGTTSAANLGCLVADGPCSGASSGLSNGVGIAGTLTFVGTDPNNQTVFNSTGNTFTVATNNRSGGAYQYLLATGSTSFSGSDPINLSNVDVYDNSQGNWAAESAAYVGNGQASIGFALTAGYSDETNPTGVTDPVNSAGITSGSVTVDYDYTYTETSLSATPEPATLFLMGTALVGVGLFRKRIKS
jgi:hypothetical protein